MRRSLSVAAAVVVVLALAAGAAAAPPCTDCLRAGAAAVPLRVPVGTPLAGYGALARRLLPPDVLHRQRHAFWFKPAVGDLDPVMARALVLATPQARVAWVALDLVAVDAALTRDVERALAGAGVAPATVLLSASHTHSGPGAFVDSALFGVLAVDREDRAVREAVVASIVEAVRRADAALVPARVGAATAAAPPVTRSRLGRPLDPDVVVLLVADGGGRPVAVVWNYAIHGTVLGPRNPLLSGDVMGVASRAVEARLGAPALFVNGAEGDVSPSAHGLSAAREIGETLAATVLAAARAARPRPVTTLATARARVTLPAPRLPLRNCLRGWVPAGLTLPLGSALPRETDLVAARVDDVAWVSAPGELDTALGLAVKRGARAAFPTTLVAGLTNDYLGYFATPEEFARPTYVTCATLFGARAGECVAASATALLGRLAGTRTDAPGGACATSAGR